MASRRFAAAWVAAACAQVVLSGQASEAATLIGLSGNALIRFDSSTPGTIISGPTPITGLQGLELILDIDHRPATTVLYGVSNFSRLFTIDADTGVATLVGTLSSPLLGLEFGFDFNPIVDRIRIVSDADQNVRVNPDTRAVTTDLSLAFANGDPHAGANPTIVGAAYTNSFPGAATTTLFGIDSNLDVLVIQNPPNGGTLNTVGPLGVNTTAILGFDIEPTLGTAFAALEVGGSSGLYTVNLGTGAVTLIGSIGSGQHVRGLAVIPFAATLIGLTTSNSLVRFNSSAPGTLVAGPTSITGLQAGESILAIDYRPTSGALYGLSNLSRLVTIDPATGVATLIATLSSPLTGNAFGFEFDAATDRVRAVTDTDQSLEVNPDTGAAIVEAPLVFAGGDPHTGADPTVVELGYTNSVPGAVTTQLFGIDSNFDILVRRSVPGSGTLHTIGALGVDTSATVGFDIEPATNAGFAALEVGGSSALYLINLNTGAATLVGSIGAGQHIRGLAVVLFGKTAPGNVVATAVSVSEADVSWSAVAGADRYEVYRRATGGTFAFAGSTIGLFLADPGRNPAQSYLYKVRAVGPVGNVSPDSASDVATTVLFVDDPLISGATMIRSQHLLEVRLAVDAIRALAGFGPAPVTNLDPFGVTIKAIHVTELRGALDTARAALGLPPVTYSNSVIAGSSGIRAVDFAELRNGTK